MKEPDSKPAEKLRDLLQEIPAQRKESCNTSTRASRIGDQAAVNYSYQEE
jgi:hypothetical protein